jgi:hypothetical protein
VRRQSQFLCRKNRTILLHPFPLRFTDNPESTLFTRGPSPFQLDKFAPFILARSLSTLERTELTKRDVYFHESAFNTTNANSTPQAYSVASVSHHHFGLLVSFSGAYRNRHTSCCAIPPRFGHVLEKRKAICLVSSEIEARNREKLFVKTISILGSQLHLLADGRYVIDMILIHHDVILC